MTSAFDGVRAADVPCGPVLSLEEVPRDLQLTSRGLFGRLHDGASNTAYVNYPVRFSDTPAGVRSPPPPLGEHTDSVLGELGYTTGDIADLRGQHIV